MTVRSGIQWSLSLVSDVYSALAVYAAPEQACRMTAVCRLCAWLGDQCQLAEARWSGRPPTMYNAGRTID